MDNLKQPSQKLTDLKKALGSGDIELDAYLSDVSAAQFRDDISKLIAAHSVALSKLELASLTIAHGVLSGGNDTLLVDGGFLAIEKASVKIAKAVLEEANK